MSEGCRHCYAESIAYRFSAPGQPYEGLVRIGADGKRRREWSGQVQFVEKHLLDPLKWHPEWMRDSTGAIVGTRPKRIFVNSMSDLFHENVTDEMRDKIFTVMALSPQHTFQVLTKRPEWMQRYLRAMKEDPKAARRAVDACQFAHMALRRMPTRAEFDAIESIPRGLPNVHLGVSCENQATADERIPLLLHTPAAVRFISVEPLLGAINLEGWLGEIEGERNVCISSGDRGRSGELLCADFRGIR